MAKNMTKQPTYEEISEIKNSIQDLIYGQSLTDSLSEENDNSKKFMQKIVFPPATPLPLLPPLSVTLPQFCLSFIDSL